MTEVECINKEFDGHPFKPFFFSIVTFTTLGYGDIAPRSFWGEILASLEVILGYCTLGLQVSILADKIRRS